MTRYRGMACRLRVTTMGAIHVIRLASGRLVVLRGRQLTDSEFERKRRATSPKFVHSPGGTAGSTPKHK